MEQKPKPVNFSLFRIRTTQFAIFDECFVKDQEIEIVSSVSFGIGAANRIVASSGSFQFEINQKPFIKLEVACEFIIDEESWDIFSQPEKGVIVFPKGLMTHITTIMVGTARGVLHTKTENTPFNPFVLPTINVTEMVLDDIEMILS